MNKLKKFYSSTILLVIGGFIINSQVRFGDGCAGMMGALSLIFFSFVYTIVFLYFFIRESILQSEFNIYPVLTTLLVFGGVAIALNIEKFESPTKLLAETRNTWPVYSLDLKTNGKFVAAIGHADWSCFYNGEYQIKNDTLTLSRHDIQIITDSSLSDIYLIDRSKNKLYPIDGLNRDTTSWLTIVPNE